METLESIPLQIRQTLRQVVGLDAFHAEEAKSAQQRVLILHYPPNRSETSPLVHVLRDGGHCLALRIWRGGSRWWNLNQAKHVQALAVAENR